MIYKIPSFKYFFYEGYDIKNKLYEVLSIDTVFKDVSSQEVKIKLYDDTREIDGNSLPTFTVIEPNDLNVLSETEARTKYAEYFV